MYSWPFIDIKGSVLGGAEWHLFYAYHGHIFLVVDMALAIFQKKMILQIITCEKCRSYAHIKIVAITWASKTETLELCQRRQY